MEQRHQREEQRGVQPASLPSGQPQQPPQGQGRDKENQNKEKGKKSKHPNVESDR